MSSLDTFCAVHTSGLLVPNQSVVTAMALIFDKVYFPTNVESIRSFAQNFSIITDRDEIPEITITDEKGRIADPFSELRDIQRTTAMECLYWSMRFARANAELFGSVFRTNAFEDGKPVKAELVKLGGPGKLNTYCVSSNTMQITEGEDEMFPKLVREGYFPLVTYVSGNYGEQSSVDQASAKQLAMLLAMKSIEMLFPRTRAAEPRMILEAREKLKDHLPQFWGAMFKLSGDLRKLYDAERDQSKLQIEAENLVDITVRPALLDLRHKIEAERKQWFFRILSPVQKGIRLMIGNPPLTQEQLISNALILASDASSAGADHLRSIEAMKNSYGLTYLLELDKLSTRGIERGRRSNY